MQKQFDDRDMVHAWLEDFTTQIVEAEDVNDIDPNHFLVWDQLTTEQQGYAFHYLLGVFADAIGIAKESDDD